MTVTNASSEQFKSILANHAKILTAKKRTRDRAVIKKSVVNTTYSREPIAAGHNEESDLEQIATYLLMYIRESSGLGGVYKVLEREVFNYMCIVECAAGSNKNSQYTIIKSTSESSIRWSKRERLFIA